jgi:hypothetical protein
MMTKWTLRLVTGTVVREKDSASVNTTIYGSSSSDAMASAQTTHSKQLWVDRGHGDVVSAHLDGTKNVSASPGDRVRIVFADPGAHVVGLTNETLQTTWKWKYPSKPGGFALLATLAIFAMPLFGLIALWRGNYAVGLTLLAITAFVIAVPLGLNRRRIRELHRQRDEMLSAVTAATSVPTEPHGAEC